MQTFTQNTVLGRIPNSKIYQQLREYAKSKGVPVFSEDCEETYYKYPNLMFNSSGRICGNSTDYGDNPGILTWITFEQFFEYCDNWQKCQSKIVKLNDEYNAEILADNVKVGCQYFTFQAIEALYNEIKK